MANTFLCPRCAADPKPEHFASERQCAFDAEGHFTPDNWNCVTLNALIGDNPRVIQGGSEQLEVTPVNGTEYGGWIVTTRYKRRGCTSSAIWVGDFSPPRPVTLALVEQILAGTPVEDED